MTPRIFRVWLLAVVASSCLSVAAQTPVEAPAAQATPPTPPAAPEEMVGPLKWPDVPLELVLEMMETWTNRTVLRPQALPPATISLKMKEAVPKSEAIRAVETALNLNGIAVVRMGERFLKVVPMQSARIESPQIIEGSSLDLPPSGQIVTKLFQFQFLRVNEFLPQIGALFNQNVSAPVIFEKSNAALITDSITTIQRIEALVEKLDQPLVSNLSPKFYNIHFAKASDLINKLRAMLQGPLQSQLGSATSYSADDRTNQVILICDPRQHVFFDELIAKLDVKSDPNTSNEVIYLKHAAAKDVASLLNSLVSGQTKAAQSSGSALPGAGIQQPVAQPNQPPSANPAIAAAIGELGSTQFSSLVTIIPDDRSNAVVINGTKDDIRLITELVDKIDIVLAQVRIEVVIAEVTLSDAASSGIDSLGLDVAGNKLMGFKGSTSGLSVGGNASSPYFYGQTPDTAAHGGPYLLNSDFAATAGRYSLVGILSLTSTPRKSNATVLSVPSITTTHNKEAKFFSGSTRPVISSFTSGASNSNANDGLQGAYTNSVSQQEIGITLTVKPLIGNDGSVQLDTKLSVTDSDRAQDVDVGGNKQPVINKREANSFNTIKSNEIIVLGGLQYTKTSHSTSRLGPIPWIGDLLGARSRGKERTELIVFIRPTVLTNTAADNVEVMKRIDTMPDPAPIRQKLDPNYVPPKVPFYKKHIEIP